MVATVSTPEDKNAQKVGGLLPLRVNPDDEVCLCFRVSLRKVRTFCKQTDPPVASLISECLGAGTGCGWCVPFLKHLHAQHQQGREMDLKVSPEEYARTRLTYHVSKKRDEDVVKRATEG
jgi:bacterioferritin-associated ferredoxin